jgi:hypothetical protein
MRSQADAIQVSSQTDFNKLRQNTLLWCIRNICRLPSPTLSIPSHAALTKVIGLVLSSPAHFAQPNQTERHIEYNEYKACRKTIND